MFASKHDMSGSLYSLTSSSVLLAAIFVIERDGISYCLISSIGVQFLQLLCSSINEALQQDLIIKKKSLTQISIMVFHDRIEQTVKN